MVGAALREYAGVSRLFAWVWECDVIRGNGCGAEEGTT